MNKDIFKGQWNQIKGKVKEKWGKLTDDDLTQINGKRDQLLGTLQKRYGYAKDRAEEEVKYFEENCECVEEENVDRFDKNVDRFNKKVDEEDISVRRKTGTEDF